MMFKKGNKVVLMIFFMLLIIGMPFVSVLAASKLDLYNYTTKKNVTYTGQQVKYTLNGKDINLRKTPGIIESGTALGSYKDVFVKSDLDVNYKYDKAKGTVTLSQNGNTIVLTIGSKTAYVNGKAKSMSVAPVKIKFRGENVTKILVPTRFVAESLGYTYTWNSSTSTAAITTPLNLEYNNKKITYTSTLGQVIIDGKKLNLGNMPSIIIDNTAMVRAKQVFSASSIKASYKYNSKTGEITLTKGDTVVALTIGSKTAYVNGKARVMDTSPVVVTNLDVNTSYVMVPGSFVSSYLGYDYTWNASTKTSIITYRNPDEEYDEDEQDGPELGDEPIKDSVEFSWNILDVNLENYNKVNSIVNSTEISEDTAVGGFLYSVEKDFTTDNTMERYIIRSTTPFNRSTMIMENNILKLTVNNTYGNNNTYTFGNFLVDNVITTYDTITNSTLVEFALKDSNVKYELTLSEDKMIMYLTVYPNYLVNVSAGTKSGDDYVELTGMNPLTVNVIEDNNIIILQLNSTINAVGDNYGLTNNLNYIKGVQSVSISGNMINLVIERNNTSTYSYVTEGNRFILTFKGELVDDSNSNFDLSIPLPTGVSFSQIEHDDRYYDKKIAIKIPGDYRSFYQGKALIPLNPVMKSVTVTYSGGYTEIILSTSKIQGYKLTPITNGVGVNIGNPKDMYDKIVVLDAGHGGTDPGAMYKLNGKTYQEKDINFSIINKSKKYFNAPDSTIKVYYSRYDDTKVPLYDRAGFASTVGADLFISVHMNANTKSSPKGTEIYYNSGNKAKLSSGLDSKKLAQLFLDALPGKIGTSKRYISSQQYVVVKANTVPAILIEVGFMSNPDDLAIITKDSTQEKTAKALYDILNQIFESYPTGR